jgi:protein-L-isoaspartate(D-aspartate) O-methyltransferase
MNTAHTMADQQLRRRGIADARVLAAMSAVPRDLFVEPEDTAAAYEDRPLRIGSGQTISQPYVVAWMAEALKLGPRDAVLEIGTGSGYAAAVLAKLAMRVDTIERHQALCDSARERLHRLGITNVEVRCGDGTLGLPEHAPFAAIVAAAAGPAVPRTLIDQLAVGGRLVMPVGTQDRQQLVRVTRTSPTEIWQESLGAVQFVPLIGEGGWQS